MYKEYISDCLGCKSYFELMKENEKLKVELEVYRGALHREHEAIHRANDLEDKIIKYLEQKIMYLKEEILKFHCDEDIGEYKAFKEILDKVKGETK